MGYENELKRIGEFIQKLDFSCKKKDNIRKYAIKKLRELKKHLSYTEITELLGVSYQSVWRWIKGKPPSLYKSVKIIIFCYEVEKFLLKALKNKYEQPD